MIMRSVFVSGLAAMMALVAASAVADEIARRKAAMDDINDAMKVLVAMVKNERPFNGEDVARSGYTVLNNLTVSATLFPEGSTTENSRAKPEIWQDLERFVGSLDKAKAAAQKVADAGAANDQAGFPKAVIQLGEVCKACHEDFRKPKKES